MPKGPRLVTKQALGKPLDKINFLGNDDDDEILLDEPVVLLPPLKKLVNVSARKSFTLNIDLVNISEKSVQDKLAVVRKLFSKINGFGRASTPSKFSGIIQTTFTSEFSLMKATKLAANVKILVNTNLKKSIGCSDWTVVLKEIPVGTSAKAVHAVLTEFGTIKSIKMQLIGLWQKSAALYSSDFIGSVGEKTCVINCHPVTYVRARCAIVCFESVESLDAVMGTTFMLKDAYLCWSYLGSAKCTKCGKLGHTSLGCVTGEKSFSGGLSCRVFSDADKSRLAAIYAKCSVPVAHSVSFSGVLWAKIVVGFSFSPFSVRKILLTDGFSLEMKPTLQVSSVLNDRFAALECSLTSFTECVDKLAKRLNTPRPTVSQLSPRC
ncbi:hypothetical protein G9A89_016049 [Geosiphon pyriformis]|nr:hypothetical protein G9A89_016049 [Geosiphon pyriformis]